MDSLAKRSFDLVLSIFGLIVFSPLLLIIAVVLLFSLGWPVLYSPQRAGRSNTLFTMRKFRSMKIAEGPVSHHSGDDDPRVTTVGRWIRKFKLDELPQLWNVLRGEMTLVGPRPERPEFVERLRQQIPYYDLRHMVKPGVTGWAQVRYPYGASVEDAVAKLEYDLYYIRHKNFLWDLRILLRTVTVVFARWGSR